MRKESVLKEKMRAFWLNKIKEKLLSNILCEKYIKNKCSLKVHHLFFLVNSTYVDIDAFSNH